MIRFRDSSPIEQAPWLNKVAVEKINNLTREENVKMVIITGPSVFVDGSLNAVSLVTAGDITNSAMPDQWTNAKKLLSQLNVPYIPVMGSLVSLGPRRW